MNMVKKIISLVLLLAVSLTLNAGKKRAPTPKAKAIPIIKTQPPARAQAEAKKKQKDTKKTLAVVAEKAPAKAAEGSEAAELKVALAASKEELPRPLRFYEETIAPFVGQGSTQKELIQMCDEINREQFTFEGEGLVKQLPGLYQMYPLLQGRYGKNYGTLCGFYALYFAQVFAENYNRSLEDLTQRLNDRNTFDVVLRQWRNALRLAPQQTYNIQGNHIDILLPGNIQEYVFIDGALAEDASAADAERFVVHRQTLVDAFKNHAIDHVIFICPTDVRGGHWITVLARRAADDNVEMIICDSIAIDRRQNEALHGLYADLTGHAHPVAAAAAVQQSGWISWIFGWLG